jgi:hypothetical protein
MMKGARICIKTSVSTGEMSIPPEEKEHWNAKIIEATLFKKNIARK